MYSIAITDDRPLIVYPITSGSSFLLCQALNARFLRLCPIFIPLREEPMVMDIVVSDLQAIFDRLVELTEPICQKIDREKPNNSPLKKGSISIFNGNTSLCLRTFYCYIKFITLYKLFAILL